MSGYDLNPRDTRASAYLKQHTNISQTNSNPIPGLALAAHGLLLSGLAAYVTYNRVQTKNRGVPNKVIRAHQNCAEHVPFLSAACLWYYFQPSLNTNTTDGLIIATTLARVLNAVGLLLGGDTYEEINVCRPIGALTTYFGTAGLAITIARNVLQNKRA